MVESPDQNVLFEDLDAQQPGAGVFYSHEKNYLPADQVSLIERTLKRIELLNEHVRAIKTSVENAPKYLDVLAWLGNFEAEISFAKLKLVSINGSTPGSTGSSTDGMPFPPANDPAILSDVKPRA